MKIVDDKDPPIEPLEYVGGVRVVDIGDLRVARGMSRRPYSACRHPRMHYDQQERRVWCPDCEHNIDSFDAFIGLVERFHYAVANVKKREAAVADAEAHALVSRGAKAIDKCWRSHGMTPTCPHCAEALLPEDFANGVKHSVSRELARAKRKAKSSA